MHDGTPFPHLLIDVLQVNFLSHVLLTMYLLPSLAKALEPRIICTTSCMQYFGEFDLETPNKGRNAYPESKIFLQTFLTELQARMLDREDLRHITAQGIHPGFVITGIWKGAQPDEAAKVTETNQKKGWLGWTLEALLHNVGIDAQQGSLAIVYAATQPECGPDPVKQGVGAKNGRGGGRYWNRTWEEEPMPQTKAKVSRDLLWDYAVKKLGLGEKGLMTILGS